MNIGLVNDCVDSFLLTLYNKKSSLFFSSLGKVTADEPPDLLSRFKPLSLYCLFSDNLFDLFIVDMADSYEWPTSLNLTEFFLVRSVTSEIRLLLSLVISGVVTDSNEDCSKNYLAASNLITSLYFYYKNSTNFDPAVLSFC